jgi:hypothetical protein
MQATWILYPLGSIRGMEFGESWLEGSRHLGRRDGSLVRVWSRSSAHNSEASNQVKTFLGRSGLLVALTAIGSLVITAAPAQAQNGGNLDCESGSHNTGAQFCVVTSWHTVSSAPNKVVMDSIELFIGGDQSTLEGGSCASNPAATYSSLKITGTGGDVKWGPQPDNEVCAPGYSDTWSTSLNGLGPISPNATVSVSFKLRNNGGPDSTGAVLMTVD